MRFPPFFALRAAAYASAFSNKLKKTDNKAPFYVWCIRAIIKHTQSRDLSEFKDFLSKIRFTFSLFPL